MKSIILISVFIVTCNCAVDFSERPRNFSIELLHYTQLQTEGHVVISPFGVWTLMVGIALGATGDSYEQLRRAFVLPKDSTQVTSGYKKLTKTVLDPVTSEVSMSSKNFVFVDDGFVMYPDFQNIITNDFSASIKVLNFQDGNTAAKIANSYIQNTGGRVSNVLTSDDFSESRMILTNVISFKGLWTYPFNKSETVIEPFYGENRQVVGKVNMMYQRAPIPFSTIEALKGLVVELPYGNDDKYSMLVMLPHYNVKVADMYKNLEKVSISDIYAKLESDVLNYGLEEIDIKIPRFKISTNLILNKPLNDMGVYDIFDPQIASLTKVSKENLFVSAIVHKADIEVTETGTVASAVSLAFLSNKISNPGFQANKPFVYFVVEKTTKTLIFGGIYSKPTIF